jgi:predicted transcriptional regulator
LTPEELKRRRKQLGLSQTALSALIGIPQNTISRWEIGAIPIGEPRSTWLDVEMAKLKRKPGRPSRRRRPAARGGAGGSEGNQ